MRSALCYLGAGLLLGAILLANRGMALGAPAPSLLPLHVEFLLIGWMVQLALGVAFWILPRFRTGAERRRERLAWISFALLNVGVLAAAIAPVVGLMPVVRPVGRAMEVAAAALFALHAWPRIKAFGREAGA